ncbi:hypothetical protein E2C01_019495 [Portunus trituberculatus]|uniref:Uncharacterized protein n=1 Tax=Portunus trituberculatus TaxID=210409 RepID=A0A5B7DXT2_PORTR|nr:hypothetical protein [Portunus trituberculatus]
MEQQAEQHLKCNLVMVGSPQSLPLPIPQAPDLDEVRESVRQGVTKVAGRLGNLANNVMSSLQYFGNIPHGLQNTLDPLGHGSSKGGEVGGMEVDPYLFQLLCQVLDATVA